MGSKRRRRGSRAWIVAGAVVFLVVVLVVSLVLQSPSPSDAVIGSPVPAAIFSPLYSLANAPYGEANSSFTSHFATLNSATYYYSGDKPVVLFIGVEGCGPCAGLRWPLILALLRFGNFSGLELMSSSSSDIFPAVPTFSFEHSSYFSNYVAFRGYEVQDRNGNAQDTVPSNYTADWRGNNSTIPYLTFANAYIVLGTFSPQSMQGMNWTQVISLVQSEKGAGQVIKQLANDMTAVICAVDGRRPAEVCSQPAITGFLLLGRSVGRTGVGAPQAGQLQTFFSDEGREWRRAWRTLFPD